MNSWGRGAPEGLPGVDRVKGPGMYTARMQKREGGRTLEDKIGGPPPLNVAPSMQCTAASPP